MGREQDCQKETVSFVNPGQKVSSLRQGKGSGEQGFSQLPKHFCCAPRLVLKIKNKK